MTNEKFDSEVLTLKKFFELYCKNKHEDLKPFNPTLTYKNKETKVQLHLCETCYKGISYSFERLNECPHEIKPRCRTCPAKCYGKKEWGAAAKIMKYSAIQLGLSKLKNKIKSKIKNIFSK